jgi:hypothetical protein
MEWAMFLSFELRQLRVAACPPPFAVLREGHVFDASLDLWALGVDWGTPGRELRWRVPEATLVDGRSGEEADMMRALHRVAGSWGTSYAVSDPRYGWIRINRPDENDWRALAAALTPAWAAWVGGGVASHPLLARWVVRAGAALQLPFWEADGFRCWVCPPEAAPRVWATVPLGAVEAPAAERDRWRQLGLKRVGEVEGLVDRLSRRLPEPEADQAPKPIAVREAFAEPLRVGVAELLEQMARRLAALLQERRQAARGLTLVWTPETGAPVARERRWPTGTADARIMAVRLALLSQPWPEAPPLALEVAASEIAAAATPQLTWWPAAQPRPASPPASAGLAPSWREVRFGYWDPWRRGRHEP